MINADTQKSSFTITNECACPGYMIVLECTVQSILGHQGGSTIWKADFFRGCDTDGEIVLLHSRFIIGSRVPNPRKICNNGSVEGQILNVDAENVTYTSRLIVRVNLEMFGQSISCEYDNGSISTGSIKLVQTQIQNGKLM